MWTSGETRSIQFLLNAFAPNNIFRSAATNDCFTQTGREWRCKAGFSGVAVAAPRRERMAQPVAQFIKRPSGTGAIQVSEAAREFEGPAVEIRSVPLQLGALLAPYREQGRLAIRIERLPHRTRLSAGQNNGDQSWSVSSDELDGLAYQFPSDIRDEPTLAVRLVNRDGATIAVLDYRVALSGARREAAADAGDATRETAARAAGAEIRDLRQELAKAKAELSARESAFVELQQRTARNWEERSQKLVDDALVKAQAQQDAEFAKRLAAEAERAELALEAARKTWQAEQSVRLAESERRARDLSSQARESWQREADAALAGAQEAWKAGEASRLASAEARWRKEAAAARADAARNQHDRAEAERLREELAATKRSLAGSERELARVRTDADQERAGWRQGTETAIAKAKNVWQAEEAIRLAAAETRLRDQFGATLAEAAVKQSRAEAALLEVRSSSQGPVGQANETELRQAREQLAALKLSLAQHDSELIQAGERARQESEAKLSRARALWQTQEAERFAAAEMRWRERSEAALAEAASRQQQLETALSEARAAQFELPQGVVDEDEIRRLHDEVAAMQSKLAYRDAELVQAHERWLQDTDTKLTQAKEEWSAGEASRLAAAEARIRRDAKSALASATARFEKAEAQLAELRARPQSETQSNDHLTILRLRDELEKLKIAIDVRDIELRHARSAAADALARWQRESQAIEPHSRPGRLSRPLLGRKLDDDERVARPLWKDVALVAGLAALLTVLYPTIASLLPDGWLPSFGSDAEEYDVPANPPVVAKKPVQPSPAPAAATPMDIVIRSANLHSDPAKASAILATLPRDSKVIPLEERGNWVLVSVAGADAPAGASKGWIYNSYLAPIPVGPAAPSAAHP